jgi:toxin ParE1/3/4
MSSHNYHLLIAPQAQQDIISILRYTGETWGKEQLLIYRNKLDEALKTIGQNPEIGHRSSELSATYRLYLVGSHVVVYRTQDEVISVVRILHQRMSLRQHL